ncbi:MAG: 5'-nucleotidase domain-containing protein, partial [Bdellovibrionales bacterium]
SELDKTISPLIRKQQQIFNPYWGDVMRTGIEESYFAYQVDRFACVYMARLRELMATSPRTYFRSQRRPLAHDLAIKADV